MLNFEAAKARLETWHLPEKKEPVQRLLEIVAGLPKPLRTLGYALFDRDANGQEFNRNQLPFDWQALQRRADAAYGELDSLSVGRRQQFFAAFFPRLNEAMERTWQLLKTTPYTVGYLRKAFRAPRHKSATWATRRAWLQGFLPIAGQFQAEVVNAPWLAAWAPHLVAGYHGPQGEIGHLLAAVLDAGGPIADEVFDILRQSITNEHEIGCLGQHVTRALLQSSRSEGWELMEKTLLAAQRQEGLRQTILETIDESHPEAFLRMLRLIRAEGLTRFSAVVRAVNVWFGLNLDSASVSTLNAILERAQTYLEDAEARRRALEGKEAEDAFLALWSIAFTDAEAAVPVAGRLLSHDRAEHRYVAALHLVQLGLPEAQRAAIAALDDADLRVAWCALTGIPHGNEDDTPRSGTRDSFERLERLFARLPEKPTQTKPIVWPWSVARLERQTVAGQMLGALGDRPPTRLLPYLRSLHAYHRQQAIRLLAEQKKWDALTREALLDLAGDAASDVRAAALEALGKKTLQRGEPERLEGYLKRKASDLRRGVLGLLASQNDANAFASADRLLADGDGPQRLAGLELLRNLAEADRLRRRCQERAERYRGERRQITREEETQLTAIADSGREQVTLENALGLLDPAERSPVVPPKKRNVVFMSESAIACLKSLDELMHEHRETLVSYEINGQKVEQLLGTFTYGFPGPEWTKPPSENQRPFPLRELFESWSSGRKKALRDSDGLELVRALAWVGINDWDWESWKAWAKRSPEHRRIVETVSSGHEPVGLRYQHLVKDVLEWLLYLDPPRNLVDKLLDLVETTFAMVPGKLHSRLVELASEPAKDQFVFEEDEKAEPDWREVEPLNVWLELLQRCQHLGGYQPTSAQWVRFWQLMHWRDEPVPGAKRDRPELYLLKEAYRAGAATLADWSDQLLGPHPAGRYGGISFGELGAMTAPSNRDNEKYFEQHPEIRALVDRCRERILEIELSRGEELTPATLPALELGSLLGTGTLLRVLTALGQQPFKVVGRWYGPQRLGRNATLTHLAGITYPTSADTPAEFSQQVRSAIAAGQFPEQRILELAFHAPQWSRHIEAFLGWPGFSEGLYWLLAHMRYITVGDQAAQAAGVTADESQDEESWNKPSAWDRLIQERTPLTADERREGAVDVGWFQRVYAQLTPKRWEAMAAASRYAANASQAKRAQLIADVLLGKTSRKELITGIRTKYLKDYVRLLGLLPLATGTKHAGDLAERYRVLQDYRRYARQLSAMSKEGALRAVEIGLQNLARTAGYPDPLRLEWAMEADTVRDLARGPVVARRDDVTVTLALDERAQPELTVKRGDKLLKSLPPEIKKKDKAIAALAERVTDLRRQSSRMRQSLELAMCRGDAISADELQQLCQHALLAPMLHRLVLVGDGILGYPDRAGKALRDCHGKNHTIPKSASLRIAHPHDLLGSGQWDQWQHECFATQRIQPFKQVFRELYVVTKQEKADGTVSRRYAGQQVNPTQANALWGQRGWNVRDGVSRTFYDVGITATVGFNYGAFTPLEVEGLTFESVQFHQRDMFEPMKLTAVPPRIFSEVMRDLDLVVSVAHRGAVDPEASASTVEMRANLVRETCRLLELANVRIKGNQVVIDGELGKYSVHLGSGVVHRMPGGAICLVPVHAQHRGRLFLPFADDDPKTAEVTSKVLLLARDTEIQDPGLLEQLRRR